MLKADAGASHVPMERWQERVPKLATVDREVFTVFDKQNHQRLQKAVIARARLQELLCTTDKVIRDCERNVDLVTSVEVGSATQQHEYNHPQSSSEDIYKVQRDALIDRHVTCVLHRERLHMDTAKFMSQQQSTSDQLRLLQPPTVWCDSMTTMYEDRRTSANVSHGAQSLPTDFSTVTETYGRSDELTFENIPDPARFREEHITASERSLEFARCATDTFGDAHQYLEKFRYAHPHNETKLQEHRLRLSRKRCTKGDQASSSRTKRSKRSAHFMSNHYSSIDSTWAHRAIDNGTVNNPQAPNRFGKRYSSDVTGDGHAKPNPRPGRGARMTCGQFEETKQATPTEMAEPQDVTGHLQPADEPTNGTQQASAVNRTTMSNNHGNVGEDETGGNAVMGRQARTPKQRDDRDNSANVVRQQEEYQGQENNNTVNNTSNDRRVRTLSHLREAVTKERLSLQNAGVTGGIWRAQWVFTLKQGVNGEEKFKARLVAQPIAGPDFDEQFAPVGPHISVRAYERLKTWFDDNQSANMSTAVTTTGQVRDRAVTDIEWVFQHNYLHNGEYTYESCHYEKEQSPL